MIKVMLPGLDPRADERLVGKIRDALPSRCAMARSLGQEESLRLIRVRPSHIPPGQWKPPLRLNLLSMPDVQAATATERWVLLFYRTKGDEIGDNMGANNPLFTPALLKNLQLAVDDIANSKPVDPQSSRSSRNTETAALPAHR